MKWKNKYIDLIQTLPDLIVPIESGTDIDTVTQLLQERSEQYKNIFCEIGSGSGLHLIEQAKRNPNNLYIGFELRYKRSFRTAQKAQEQNLSNLLVIRGSAELIPQLFKSQSISGFYINFPDPWAKRRWRKHRLLNPVFLEQLAKLLMTSGFISYKTDHKEYFLSSKAVFEKMTPFTLKEYTEDLYNSEFIDQNITTEFEQLFRSQNLPVFFLKAECR